MIRNAALALALCAGAASAARADGIARGRALVWGARAIVPCYVGDARARDGRAIRYLAPGGGIEGHIGYEFPAGIGLAALAGVAVHASHDSRALATIRAGVEGRWTIDVGADVAPLLAIGVGALLVRLDAGLGATVYGRALGGVQVLLAPWAALDLAISVEGALPLEVFADAVAWLSPQIGVTFSE